MSQPPPSPLPPRPQRGELAKFIAGFGYAFRGLWYALYTQRNARVHLALAILAVLLGIALRISAVEFAMIFVAITAVFVAEMVNTAIELCVDLASPEYHPLAKIAKDVSAGAVLLSAILAVVIALFVFVPHLWPLIISFLHHGLASVPVLGKEIEENALLGMLLHH